VTKTLRVLSPQHLSRNKYSQVSEIKKFFAVAEFRIS